MESLTFSMKTFEIVCKLQTRIDLEDLETLRIHSK